MQKYILFTIILSFFLIPILAKAQDESTLDLQIQLLETQFDKLGWEKLYYIERVKNIDSERIKIMAELVKLRQQKVIEQKETEEAKKKAEKIRKEDESLRE